MFTGLLITVLILAGAATAVGGGLALAKRRKSLPSGNAGPKLLTDGGPERGLDKVRVGDVLTYGGHDYLIEGVLAYDEDGHKWNGARVTDGQNERWLILGVERIGDMTVRLVDIDPEMEITGYPPETLIAGGMRYTLDKRGTASARFSGEVGRIPGSKAQAPGTVERCRWWLYNTTGDDTLLLEQWGGEYRALRGTLVHPGLIEMIPGS